ncbi:hypothetical protein [Bathymodiolus japonicus methanotrophic gill symbiont]|uniref:hypothetical protein n=1 Tax=Bathymodiolus japonicus methanotrophic gill symbiont TaxID=113269 RepID=UPI001C8F0419|nr:hypothetical protein [Bathymodiolus japonicus methanotrophic gill symbiont]
MIYNNYIINSDEDGLSSVSMILSEGNNSSQKHLYVYDKAVTDFVWWDRQKRHANYMISMLKENSIATLVESIPFDSQHEINTGVEAYSVYENKGIKFLGSRYFCESLFWASQPKQAAKT